MAFEYQPELELSTAQPACIITIECKCNLFNFKARRGYYTSLELELNYLLSWPSASIHGRHSPCRLEVEVDEIHQPPSTTWTAMAADGSRCSPPRRYSREDYSYAYSQLSGGTIINIYGGVYFILHKIGRRRPQLRRRQLMA